MRQKTVFLILTVILFSCSKNSNEICYEDLDTSYDTIGIVKLKVDELTSIDTRYFRRNSVEGEELVSFVNEDQKRIQSYNTSNGMIESIIDYSSIEFLGKSVSGFYLISKDSILLFDRWEGIVSLIDSESELLSQWSLTPNGNNSGYAHPTASSASPLFFNDHKLVVSGMIPGAWRGLEIDNKVFLSLDLKDDTVVYKFSRPPMNEQYNWGNDLLNYIYFDINKRDREIYVGFANSSEIIVTDFDLYEKRRFNLKSEYFDKIVPFSDDFYETPDPEKLTKYYFSTPRFWGVFFDEFRNQVVRIVQFPYCEQKYSLGYREMNTSVLVYDLNGVKIDEFFLKNTDFNFNMIYVDKNGLNIASRSQFKQDEDYLSFLTFDITYEP